MDIQPWKPPSKRPNRRSLLVLAAALAALLCAVGLASLLGRGREGAPPASAGTAASTPGLPQSGGASTGGTAAAAANEAEAEAAALASGLPAEMRAMWISYLEFQDRDISTEAAMRAICSEMFSHCAELGLNTVIVAVRPFGDAFYPSALFPWSHHLTGEQGADPGYDPLAVMLEEAHARGLRFEAWVNPFRVKGVVCGPESLSADNPAAQNPEWYTEINGAWYDPGLPEVRRLVVDGMLEIAQNYEVDGIHIDDYFYPEFSAEQKEAGEDEAFDEASYAAYGEGRERAEWRRENVNTFMQEAYTALKAARPGISFGVSPQGNNSNNYDAQYSDVRLWLEQGGYCDYVAPQLYWGFDHVLSSGDGQYAFGRVSETWASWPRAASVQLYAGLGVYRIEDGDGSSGDQSEWQSGSNIARMVEHLRGVNGFSGFMLFRYNSLYNPANPLAAQEAAALTALLNPPPPEAAPEAQSAADAQSAPGEESAPAAGSTAEAGSALPPAESTPSSGAPAE